MKNKPTNKQTKSLVSGNNYTTWKAGADNCLELLENSLNLPSREVLFLWYVFSCTSSFFIIIYSILNSWSLDYSMTG